MKWALTPTNINGEGNPFVVSSLKMSQILKVVVAALIFQRATATAMATSSTYWKCVVDHAPLTLTAMGCATILTNALVPSMSAASATAQV
ncbi:MAG: hypothetical protein CMC99_06020 [Flavobacteriales bacterium]|nr:hypothetical protein [Flavobacteriales bacterium]